uniref:F-box domain-containing protein n=1 Tax=Panagrolaimus davidi TaxID=227884 RepID=A0A914QZB6_9BILA
MITFNIDGMVYQRFGFPAPIMDYIFKNLKPHHLVKLYQCSKYFYAKFRQNIIQHLEIVNDGEPEHFNPALTSICFSNSALPKLIDFWITDSFVYRAPMNGKFLPSFSNCTIEKLELCDYILWSEYKIITKAESIKEMKIIGILDFGDFVPIEDIIAEVPNASSIEISESITTATTYSSLMSLNHKAKISNVAFKNVSIFEPFDFVLLRDFFLKNAVTKCNILFEFKLFHEENQVFHDFNVRLKELSVHCSKQISLRLKQRELLSRGIL